MHYSFRKHHIKRPSWPTCEHILYLEANFFRILHVWENFFNQIIFFLISMFSFFSDFHKKADLLTKFLYFIFQKKRKTTVHFFAYILKIIWRFQISRFPCCFSEIGFSTKKGHPDRPVIIFTSFETPFFGYIMFMNL